MASEQQQKNKQSLRICIQIDDIHPNGVHDDHTWQMEHFQIDNDNGWRVFAFDENRKVIDCDCTQSITVQKHLIAHKVIIRILESNRCRRKKQLKAISHANAFRAQSNFTTAV